MGDRVAVMRKAELQQVAPPQELYDHPVNMFVAGFIGSPAMNMLEARIDRRDGQLVVVFGSTTVALDDAKLAKHAALASFAGRDVVLGIRPEDLEDAALSDGDRPRLAARVTLREALGSEVLVHFTIDARQAMTDEMRELAEDVGDDRGAKPDSQPGHRRPSAALVGRFSPRTNVVEGDTVEVSIDQHALHFFDPDTGAAIYGEDAGACGPDEARSLPFGCAAEQPALERPLRGDEDDRDGDRCDQRRERQPRIGSTRRCPRARPGSEAASRPTGRRRAGRSCSSWRRS